MIIDHDRLLAPVTVDDPAGSNIRAGGSDTALYYQIKDARSAARLTERQAEADPERSGLAPEWRTVHDLAQRILCEVSKDVEVAVWLVEASIRLDGFAGLRDGLGVLDGLVERYWDDLHPMDADDPSIRTAPIAGLNGVGAEGSLIQPIRLAPFSDPTDGEPANLWHYMIMRKRGPDSPQASLIASAVRGTAAPMLVAIYQDVSRSAQLYRQLTERLDAACGADSPPSSTVRNVLEEVLDAMRDVARDALANLEPETERPAGPAPVQPAAPTPIAPPPGIAPPPQGPATLRNREDALRELSRIAVFFRDYEPNSPTAYALETVIRRARLTLDELLAELIPEDASRRTYLDLAGIRPAAK